MRGTQRHSTVPLRRRQRGLTITEAILTLGIASAVATGAYGIYKVARADVTADDLARGTVRMLADTQNIFGTNGGYAVVTPANINSTGLVPPGWRWDGANVLDNRGSIVTINGAAGSFAFVFTDLSASDCAKAATKMESMATSIRVGATAAAAAGVISGGSVYKAADGTISAANLATGCGQANRKIAVQAQ